MNEKRVTKLFLHLC